VAATEATGTAFWVVSNVRGGSGLLHFAGSNGGPFLPKTLMRGWDFRKAARLVRVRPDTISGAAFPDFELQARRTGTARPLQ